VRFSGAGSVEYVFQYGSARQRPTFAAFSLMTVPDVLTLTNSVMLPAGGSMPTSEAVIHVISVPRD